MSSLNSIWMCDLFLDLLVMRFTPKYVSSWASGPLIGPLESGWDLQSLRAGKHKSGIYTVLQSRSAVYGEPCNNSYSLILSIRSSVPAVKEDWQGQMAPSQCSGRCVRRWALSALTVCCCHTGSGRSSLWVSLYLERDASTWKRGFGEKALRSWSIYTMFLTLCVFVGESVDDCGGGYSESIAEMCEELQNGLTPLLIVTPNGRDESGANRDCFLLNPAAKSPLHISMFRFLGTTCLCFLHWKDLMGKVYNFTAVVFPSLDLLVNYSVFICVQGCS